MNAPAKCCPLCRQPAAQGTLDLRAVRFLAHANKRAAILRLIREVGSGLTVAEITRVLKFSHASVSARVHDLERANEIKKHGRRATDSGRLAWVWVPIDQASADTEQLREKFPFDSDSSCAGGGLES